MSHSTAPMPVRMRSRQNSLALAFFPSKKVARGDGYCSFILGDKEERKAGFSSFPPPRELWEPLHARLEQEGCTVPFPVELDHVRDSRQGGQLRRFDTSPMPRRSRTHNTEHRSERL